MSKTTILKALKRFLYAFLAGGLTAFAMVAPGNLESFKDIRAWLIVVGFAFINGGILGIQKAISGYFKYDKDSK